MLLFNITVSWIKERKIKMKVMFLCLTIVSLVSVPSALLSKADIVDFNKRMTESIRINWPFYAFLAIPRITEMSPNVSFHILPDEKKISSIQCLELSYHEARKEFEPKAVLERKSLHKLLCKSMKRAIERTGYSIELYKGIKKREIGLKFNFYNGTVELVEIPYPPLDPSLKLEDVFVDEDKNMSFGGIDFPKDENLEISETPL